jgi:hypothetical protein
MTGHTTAPDRVWSSVLTGSNGYAPLPLVCVLLIAACARPAVYPATPTDSLPPSIACQAGDCHVLAGEWEYVDGAAVRLTLDEQGNGHYDWKDGRFETHSLIDHTWQGMWFQKENDREGGFTVEFSPDFSEGEGRWWVSRLGANQTATQKEGTFHLSKKTALMDHSDTPPAR